ncbi:MAG TPA: ABC transporter permease subunit [Bosea sp. (in: a-proteobacteria)]|uniref:ABC transporter permease n=1 Tax=Bosea sp. (in: a-proteobacteria) TaxID=1871050 RepID=UPI002E16530F|nr:ABC transporter permease subunit [Bosea sp. (in: a-proteobacteria)]
MTLATGNVLPRPAPSQFRIRLRGDYLAMASFAVLAAMALGAIFAPWLAPYDPLAIEMTRIMQTPSGAHWFGTDGQGRDIFSRVLFGLRLTAMMGFCAIAVGGAIGTAIGLLAAFYPRLDGALMRLMDVLLSFPAILFGLAVAAIIGAGTLSVIIALAISTVPLTARIARGAGLTVIAQDYIAAGRVIGLTDSGLLLRYILPNCLSTIVVFLTLRLGQAILLAASLGFLGLGTQPPAPELGTMAAQGVNFFFFAPHVTIIPSLVIFALVLATNILGDFLRDILDPRLRG